jgi:hypothetical protein
VSIFEALMLICFGAAWPVSIYKTYKTKATSGKSILFLCIIVVGYISGIIHKLLYSYDYVIFLYILNSVMVSTDIFLYLKYKKLEASAVGLKS